MAERKGGQHEVAILLHLVRYGETVRVLWAIGLFHHVPCKSAHLEDLHANPNCHKNYTANEQDQDQILFAQLLPIVAPRLYRSLPLSREEQHPKEGPSLSFLGLRRHLRPVVCTDAHSERAVTVLSPGGLPSL